MINDSNDIELESSANNNVKISNSNDNNSRKVIDLVDSDEDSSVMITSEINKANEHDSMIKGLNHKAGILHSNDKYRRFVNIPSNCGGLIVGSRFHHVETISNNAGDNCHIRFLPKEKTSLSNSNAPGNREKGNTWLVIEADSEAACEVAETALIERIHDLLLDDKSKYCYFSSNSKLSSKETTKSKDTVSSSNSSTVANTYKVVLSSNSAAKQISGNPAQQKSHDHINNSTLPQQGQVRFIAVDNSNIFLGARHYLDDNSTTAVLRLSPTKVATLLRNGSEVPLEHTCVAGTALARKRHGDNSVSLFSQWEEAGFRVKLSVRDKCTHKETAVDECLHAFSYWAISVSEKFSPGSHCLVLATGDGNDNDGFTNFVDIATQAVLKGLSVEIWSWKKSCSRKYVNLAQQYPEKLKVIYLDEYSDSVFDVIGMGGDGYASDTSYSVAAAGYNSDSTFNSYNNSNGTRNNRAKRRQRRNRNKKRHNRNNENYATDGSDYYDSDVCEDGEYLDDTHKRAAAGTGIAAIRAIANTGSNLPAHMEECDSDGLDMVVAANSNGRVVTVVGGPMRGKFANPPFKRMRNNRNVSGSEDKHADKKVIVIDSDSDDAPPSSNIRTSKNGNADRVIVIDDEPEAAMISQNKSHGKVIVIDDDDSQDYPANNSNNNNDNNNSNNNNSSNSMIIVVEDDTTIPPTS